MARGEHAKLMPSRAHRWMTCPGSVVMEEAAPERRTGYEGPGTVCHMMLANVLRRRILPEQYLGEFIDPETEEYTTRDYPGAIEVTSDMVEWVQHAASWVEFAVAAHPGTVLRVEEPVIVGAAFGCPDALWGTPDIVLVRPDLVTVVDAKFGFEDVEVNGNPQVSLYTIGVAHDYGWRHEMFELGIVQPRSNPPVSIEMLTRAELEDRRDRYRSAVQAALRPQAPLVPSDECPRCSAAGMCPAYQEWARSRATLALAEPETIELAKLGQVVAAAPAIRSALKAAERYALQRLALGFDVPGLKRVAGKRGNRKWANEEDAQRVLGMLMDPERFMTKPELVSPAQAEALLKLPRHVLDNLAPAPEGAPMLVPEDDPRPALPPVFDYEPDKEDEDA